MSIAWTASTPEIDAIFSTEAEIQSWLDVEAALARAEARHGLVPDAAAAEITAKARVEELDLAQLAADIRHAVHPVMPFVRAFAAVCDDGHGEYVHWGTTTQDVLDTGLVLRLRAADAVLDRDLEVLVETLREVAVRHRDTPMAGRTHAQHAVPITLGYKLSVWVDELRRHRATLARIRPEVMVGQLGGATGTLASLGIVGLAVRRDMFDDLALSEPAISWHVARDRLAHHAFVLTLVAASIARLAAEIVALQRDEIAEVFEPFHAGKVGSSTMPHKRNPAVSESLMTLGELVKNDLRNGLSSLGSLHERDKAIFSIETEYVPRICGHVHRMIQVATTVVSGLTVDVERMRANLETSRGQLFSENVMMALAGRIGRQRAHDVVHAVSMRAFDERVHLRQALGDDAEVIAAFSREELDALFDLGQLNEAAGRMVDDVCVPPVPET